MNRTQMLEAADSGESWDVVVIGGGSTGLGTALDAVSRGYRTILLEARDFAHGTSSRSTKLIHGGIRYLRQGRVGMVRESLRERGLLLQNAPHIVHPLNFVIPAYRPGARWYYFAGLWAYDLLAGKQGLSPTRLLSRSQTMAELPTLQSAGLQGGVLYTDAQFDDARLAVTLALTAAAHGAIVLNYAPVTSLIREGSRTVGVRAVDAESGRELIVRGTVVINATGVFTDSIQQMDIDPNESPRPSADRSVTPSQGSHLVLDRSFLPTETALMIPQTDDGRVLFAIPWQKRVLFGTTDVAVTEIATEPRPLQEEVDYLLRYAGRYLTRPPGSSDILSMFSGLRPLIRSQRAAAATSQVTREHEIRCSANGLISVIGGKWTTFRQMGEDVIDQAVQVVGLAYRPSGTRHLSLLAEPQPQNQPLESPVDAGDLQRLMHPRLPFMMSQVVQAVQTEMACTLEDVLSRRTRALILDARAAIDAAPGVADLMMRLLQRTPEWKEQQIRNFLSIARGYYPE